MHTIHRARILAPWDTVFGLVCNVEAWPRLLPSYRWCRVIERGPDRLVFTMAGWIRGWPARWTAVQEARPEERRVRFAHIGGITTGMQVEWRLVAAPNDVEVELVHDFVMRWPLVGHLVGDLIIGPIFIDHIARHTLRVVKAAAEASTTREQPEVTSP